MLSIVLIAGLWATQEVSVEGKKESEVTSTANESPVHTVPERKEVYIDVWATANLNIRKEPDIKSNIVGSVCLCEKIEVTYINSEWAKIKDSGYYVSKKYLSETEVKPSDFYIEKEFKLTAYCPCESCSGKWGSKTSTGKTAKAGRTIAVDPSVIPYGTEVEIDGCTYIAEDCGGGVKGNHIDIFFDFHYEVDAFGKKYETVKIFY